jgi:hypothetical protein
VPDHQVHRPVGQRLRLRDETLRTAAPQQQNRSGGESEEESGRAEGESRGAYVRVVLAPGLALLGEAAAGNSPRHSCCCGGGGGGGCSSSAGGVWGLDFLRGFANRVPLRTGRSYLTPSFFFLSLFLVSSSPYFLRQFPGEWAPAGQLLAGPACQGSGWRSRAGACEP